MSIASEIIDLVDKYIDNNALKLALMHGANPPMRVVERCLEAVKKGFMPIPTFISPAELALKMALIEAKLPMIRVVPDALATVYRPKEDEPRQFAEGRLLLLSRVCKAGVSRYDAWHGVNDAISSIALKARPAQDGERGGGNEAEAVKGAAVYVVLN